MQDALVTVEHNLFEECDGEIEIISNKSGKNTFRHNTFRRSSGTLTLRHGNWAEVYGNYFLGEGRAEAGGSASSASGTMCSTTTSRIWKEPGIGQQ